MSDTEEMFLRLSQVLDIIPISRSCWWKGCKEGKYPTPLKIGARTTVWRAFEIQELVARLSGGKGENGESRKMKAHFPRWASRFVLVKIIKTSYLKGNFSPSWQTRLKHGADSAPMFRLLQLYRYFTTSAHLSSF